MNIYQFRVFCSVIENKSFTRTAQDYWLSQPTVSAHIKALEDHFQVRLLKRGRKGIEATEAGLLVYQAAKKIIQELTNLDLGLTELKQHIYVKPGTTITVGASSTPASYLLPPIIMHFTKTYPSIRFSIQANTASQIIRFLKEGSIDLGFAQWEEIAEEVSKEVIDTKDLVVEFLHRENLVLVASTQNKAKIPVLKGGNVLVPSDLMYLPLILPPPTSPLRKNINRQLRDYPLHIVMDLGPAEALKKALSTFCGASILSEISVREDIQRGELFPITLEGFSLYTQFALLRYRHRAVPAITKEFVSYMEGRLK
ncbi:LysR family transcriptional regulator [Paradesulfitobacterium ferrireducens]|uniref:LysR family transcriptional regulator n=1 Tax=Paradesulfitobacterium ferrireducens TaxID=2816476 RepID=UPI001A90AE59|nr:LysR family transcriptional regulator [Paradesulfitobacterium ferrireducens]